MKKLLLLTKTLLVAALLMVGVNAWADPIETVGSLSSGWWTDFSNAYPLEGYGKYHFQFTTTNANDGNGYKTWLLVATDGDYPESYTGKGGSHTGAEYFVWRGDSYAWGQTKNSNDNPTLLACSNTYSGENMQAAMNGASVDLIVTRESNNIYATATITPTNGDSEFTMSFSYLFGNATSANIGLFLTVQNAQVVLNTAEQTAAWTTVWNADFSSAPSGMTYSVTNGSCDIANGYISYHQGGGSGDRAINTAFTDAKFNVDSDWILEFDWNCSSANTNASNVVFATNSGTAFSMEWASYASAVVVKDGGGTSICTTLPLLGYNKGTCTSWSHITINGVKDEGVYLTITNGSVVYVNKQLVTSTFGYPATFNGSLGKAVSHMYVDNVFFKTPAVAGFVATPTSEITGAAGTSRKFTLSCLTDGATIYYATSDLEKGAAGWNTYTGEVTTDATTIYAYAKDDEDNTSDKMNFATGAGTTIDLLPATVTHSNNGVYTIASNQSAILGSPTATIHYQIDGGSEQTSTNASVNVNIAADGTLTYWLTAEGYGATDPENETVYAAVGYAVTRTIDFKTSNENTWAVKGDEVTVTGDTHTYYKYKDQSDNILGDGLLATSFENDASSWRIQRYYGGTSPYNNTEYIALKNLAAGQIVQFACTSAPSIVANLTAVPASTYTGTFTYSATAGGDVIVSLAKGVVITTIKLCATSVSGTITDAGWSTFASPYALDLSTLTATSGATAYYSSEATGSTVTLSTTDATVPAGEGIMVKGTAGETFTINVAASGTAISGNLLKGQTTTGNVAASTAGTYHYVFGFKKPEDVVTEYGFYNLASDTEVAAGKAYLETEEALLARALRIVFDDVTGVEKIEAAAETKVKEGKFIENGKLVIVKNGVKYNAAGQQVK